MHVIKLSLPGFDVNTATPEQCAVYSKFNSPKIDSTKEHFITFNIVFLSEPPDAGVGSTRETILYAEPHGYSYIPELYLHVDYTSSFATVPEYGPGEALIASASAGDDAYVGVRADRINYYLYVRKHRALNIVAVAGRAMTARLYICAETVLE